MEMLIDVFTDAAIDCIKMLPFLFLAFLLIEALEHYSSDFTKKLMIKVDKAGPVVGAVVGTVGSSMVALVDSVVVSRPVKVIYTVLFFSPHETLASIASANILIGTSVVPLAFIELVSNFFISPFT